jgi:signal transduction histidine kinase
MENALRSRQAELDWAATVVLAVLAGAQSDELAGMPAVPRPVALLLVAASVLPAAVRRRWSRVALALTATASAAVMALSSSPAVPIATAFVMYLVPLRFSRREALTLLAGALAVLGAGAGAFAGISHGVQGHGGSRETLVLLAESWLAVGGAWAAGDMVRQRRAAAALRRELADHAIRERLAEARRAATATRVEIARELHDVVAHSLSLIAVQAGVANWVVESQPAEAARALSSIEEISRGALHEMRVLLGVLRTAGDDPDPAQAGSQTAAPALELAPAKGLADLDELASRVTATGVAVSVAVQGSRVPLPPGLDLAAYRVVQEAVTNVVKHAGASSCQVNVSYTPDEVALEIRDNGRGPAGSAGPDLQRGGHGLTGMRERVAMYGGQFAAGSASGGGFVVTARLPLAVRAAA